MLYSFVMASRRNPPLTRARGSFRKIGFQLLAIFFTILSTREVSNFCQSAHPLRWIVKEKCKVKNDEPLLHFKSSSLICMRSFPRRFSPTPVRTLTPQYGSPHQLPSTNSAGYVSISFCFEFV